MLVITGMNHSFWSIPKDQKKLRLCETPNAGWYRWWKRKIHMVEQTCSVVSNTATGPRKHRPSWEMKKAWTRLEAPGYHWVTWTAGFCEFSSQIMVSWFLTLRTTHHLDERSTRGNAKCQAWFTCWHHHFEPSLVTEKVTRFCHGHWLKWKPSFFCLVDRSTEYTWTYCNAWHCVVNPVKQ